MGGVAKDNSWFRNMCKVEKVPVSHTAYIFLVHICILQLVCWLLWEQRIKRVKSEPMSDLGHCENSSKKYNRRK